VEGDNTLIPIGILMGHKEISLGFGDHGGSGEVKTPIYPMEGGGKGRGCVSIGFVEESTIFYASMVNSSGVKGA